MATHSVAIEICRLLGNDDHFVLKKDLVRIIDGLNKAESQDPSSSIFLCFDSVPDTLSTDELEELFSSLTLNQLEGLLWWCQAVIQVEQQLVEEFETHFALVSDSLHLLLSFQSRKLFESFTLTSLIPEELLKIMVVYFDDFKAPSALENFKSKLSLVLIPSSNFNFDLKSFSNNLTQIILPFLILICLNRDEDFSNASKAILSSKILKTLNIDENSEVELIKYFNSLLQDEISTEIFKVFEATPLLLNYLDKSLRFFSDDVTSFPIKFYELFFDCLDTDSDTFDYLLSSFFGIISCFAETDQFFTLFFQLTEFLSESFNSNYNTHCSNIIKVCISTNFTKKFSQICSNIDTSLDLLELIFKFLFQISEASICIKNSLESCKPIFSLLFSYVPHLSALFNSDGIYSELNQCHVMALTFIDRLLDVSVTNINKIVGDFLCLFPEPGFALLVAFEGSPILNSVCFLTDRLITSVVDSEHFPILLENHNLFQKRHCHVVLRKTLFLNSSSFLLPSVNDLIPCSNILSQVSTLGLCVTIYRSIKRLCLTSLILRLANSSRKYFPNVSALVDSFIYLFEIICNMEMISNSEIYPQISAKLAELLDVVSIMEANQHLNFYLTQLFTRGLLFLESFENDSYDITISQKDTISGKDFVNNFIQKNGIYIPLFELFPSNNFIEFQNSLKVILEINCSELSIVHYCYIFNFLILSPMTEIKIEKPLSEIIGIKSNDIKINDDNQKLLITHSGYTYTTMNILDKNFVVLYLGNRYLLLVDGNNHPVTVENFDQILD
ncbi:hypothetical protein RCL1_003389 [Eukaryota sp. TZLM3-RCL]